MSVLVSTVFDYGDVFCKSSSLSTHKGFPPVRKALGSPVNIPSQRRNSSNSIAVPPSPPSPKSPLVLHSTTNGLAFSLTPQNNSNITSREHPKLDRSLSEPVEPSRGSSGTSTSSGTQPRQSQPNSSRYKTELCRPFEENGTCKYGDKCQFAHGVQELRTLVRHPKYKTELCRTYHSTGFCPYGPRCHFIHNSEESRKNLLNHLQAGLQAIGRQDASTATTHAHSIGSTRPKALSIGSFSLGSAGDLSPPSSVSGSPTSLNSFFAEDPFAAGYTTNPSAALPAKTAFSFSHDFATLVNSMKHHPQSGIHLPTFGGSQPALTQYELSAALASLPGNAGELYVENTYPDAIDAIQSLAGFEPSPPSPVESLSSELECLNVTTNPEPPVCTSPSEISRSPPRLPIFSRLANSDLD